VGLYPETLANITSQPSLRLATPNFTLSHFQRLATLRARTFAVYVEAIRLRVHPLRGMTKVSVLFRPSSECLALRCNQYSTVVCGCNLTRVPVVRRSVQIATECSCLSSTADQEISRHLVRSPWFSRYLEPRVENALRVFGQPSSTQMTRPASRERSVSTSQASLIRSKSTPKSPGSSRR